MKIVYSLGDECPLSDIPVVDPSRALDLAKEAWVALGKPQIWLFDAHDQAPWYHPAEVDADSKVKKKRK